MSRIRSCGIDGRLMTGGRLCFSAKIRLAFSIRFFLVPFKYSSRNVALAPFFSIFFITVGLNISRGVCTSQYAHFLTSTSLAPELLFSLSSTSSVASSSSEEAAFFLLCCFLLLFLLFFCFWLGFSLCTFNKYDRL